MRLGELELGEKLMSRHKYALAGALAVCLTIMSAPQATQALPVAAKLAPASRAIILAKRECIAWKKVNGKIYCVNWADCKPGDKIC
jgi:hypothetical protein